MRSSSSRDSSENSGTRESSSTDSPGLIGPPPRGELFRAGGLTGFAPIRGAVLIALPARPDGRSAAWAGAPRAAVDRAWRAAGLEPVAHEGGGLDHEAPKLIVAQVREATPRIDPGRPAALALVDVSDTGQDPLVEEHLTDLPRLIRPAQCRDTGRCVELRREHVRAEGAQARIRAHLPLRPRAVSLDRLHVSCCEYDPGTAMAGALLGGNDPPRPAHAEMGVKDEIGVEMKQEMLALRLDLGHRRPDEL